MSPRSKQEYLRAVVPRYVSASKATTRQILTEVCATTGYHRKSAIRRLRQVRKAQLTPPHRRRPQTYGTQTVTVLAEIWAAAGYPWLARLKKMIGRSVTSLDDLTGRGRSTGSTGA